MTDEGGAWGEEYGVEEEKPVLVCDTFGCGQRPVDESGRCRVCREAFKNGFCKGYQKRKDDSGVRGREEIVDEIQEEIEDRIDFLEEDLHKMERAAALKWVLSEVLGVRDEL